MKKIILLGLVISPSFAFAASVQSILVIVSNILGVLIPILVTLAVVWFIWGVILYLISGDEEKKKKAKGQIFSGLIGLFVIVAFWGIIRVITTTFGVGPEQLNKAAIPCVPNPNAIPPITCGQ